MAMRFRPRHVRVAVIASQHVEHVVLSVGVPVVDAVGEGRLLHEPRLGLIGDARQHVRPRVGGDGARRHRRDAAGGIARVRHLAAGRVGDLRQVVGRVVGVEHVARCPGDGARFLGDVAARVVGPGDGPALVRHRGEAALAVVARGDRVVGVGYVLGRGGGIAARQHAAGGVVGHVGDDAARVGGLGDEPARIADVIGDAAVRARLADDLAEAVADVGRLEVARATTQKFQTQKCRGPPASMPTKLSGRGSRDCNQKGPAAEPHT